MTRQGLEYWLFLRDSNFESGMGKATRATKGLDMAMGRVLRGAAGFAAGAFAISNLKRYGDEIINTTAKMEGYTNVLKFASKDQQDLLKNQKFLNGLITDMKLPLMESYDGYSKLLGAMRNTPLENHAKDIFRGVSTMSTVLHLDNYRQGLVNYALTQMVSKGTVSSEELKRQLGESLPGAMSLAARAMKMPMDAFNKALEAGKIKAIDFLPAFAKILEDEFSKGLPDALNSMQARMTEASNNRIKLKLELGEKMQPAYLEFLEMQNKGIEGAMNMVKWSVEHKGLLVSIGKAAMWYAGVQLTILAYKKAAWVLDKNMLTLGWLRVRQEIAIEKYTQMRAKGLGKIKSIYASLSSVVMPNPLGWIAAGVSALAFFYSKWKETQKQMAEDLKDPMNWGDYFKYQGLGMYDDMPKPSTGLDNNITIAASDNNLGSNLGFGQKLKHDIFSERLEQYKELLTEATSADALEKLLDMPFKITKRNVERILGFVKDRYGIDIPLEQIGFSKLKDGSITKTTGITGGVGGDYDTSSSAGSVGAGRQVRNVTVTINGGLVQALTFNHTNLAQSAKEIENIVKEALVRTVRDSEIALG